MLPCLTDMGHHIKGIQHVSKGSQEGVLGESGGGLEGVKRVSE